MTIETLAIPMNSFDQEMSFRSWWIWKNVSYNKQTTA